MQSNQSLNLSVRKADGSTKIIQIKHGDSFQLFPGETLEFSEHILSNDVLFDRNANHLNIELESGEKIEIRDFFSFSSQDQESSRALLFSDLPRPVTQQELTQLTDLILNNSLFNDLYLKNQQGLQFELSNDNILIPRSQFDQDESSILVITNSFGQSNSSSSVRGTEFLLEEVLVANNDAFKLNEDQIIIANVAGNDASNLGAPFTLEILNGPANGSIIFNPDGSFQFIPNQNFSGQDQFTYRATSSINTLTDDATVTLTINPINDAPVLNPGIPNGFLPTGSTTINFFDTSLSITDVDDTHLESLTVTLTNLKQAGNEILDVTTIGNINKNYDPGTGILTLTGTDTLANYEVVLESLTYHNTAGIVDTSTRHFNITANDGDDNGNSTVSLLKPTATITGNTISMLFGSSFKSIATGDFNKDGFYDIILGGRFRGNFGEANVIYGKADEFSGTTDLGTLLLIPNAGFHLSGIGFDDELGSTVGGGDFNGDGFDDFAIGANESNTGHPGSSTPFGIATDAGRTYTLFGTDNAFPVSSSIEFLLEGSGGDGTQGFTIDALNNDFSLGNASLIADINGDGLADVFGGNTSFSGNAISQVNVKFGEKMLDATEASIFTNELNGTNGFSVLGPDEQSFFGVVSPNGSGNAGDVNGDGIVDVLIGAYRADIEGNTDQGASYLLLGRPTFSATVTAATETIVIEGLNAGDNFGLSSSTGSDINHDGFNDLIIGAPLTDINGVADVGQVFVYFGHTTIPNSIDISSLLPENGGDGSMGFVINGLEDAGQFGRYVTGGGDLNADGIDDIVISAPRSDGSIGSAYAIFGRTSTYDPVLDLHTLDSSQGFKIEGELANDFLGLFTDIAGDLNGDGYDDLLVLAPFATVNGATFTGKTEIIYGEDFSQIVTHQGTNGNDNLVGDNTRNIMVGGQGNDTLIGNGGADTLKGGNGDDNLVILDSTFIKIDGDGGIDTLSLAGGNFLLDLTTIANNRIQDVERIDITGSGNNTLNLDVHDIIHLTDSDNKLTIFGDAGDIVNVDLTGHNIVDQGIQGGFQVFNNSAIELSIDPAVTINALI